MTRASTSASATICWRAPRRPRSRSPTAATTTDRSGPRRSPGSRSSWTQPAARRRARRGRRPHRRGGARDRGPGRPRAGAVDALYFTGGSTGLRLLTDRLAARVPGGAAGARRPLRQRRDRARAACAQRRFARRCGTPERPRSAPSYSTAAIASAVALDILRVQARPRRCAPSGRGRRAYSSRRRSTCARRQAGVAEHAALRAGSSRSRGPGIFAARTPCSALPHRQDALAHRVELAFPGAAQRRVGQHRRDDLAAVDRRARVVASHRELQLAEHVVRPAPRPGRPRSARRSVRRTGSCSSRTSWRRRS